MDMLHHLTAPGKGGKRNVDQRQERADCGLELVYGYVRVKGMLDVQGQAWVYNTSTNEQLEVYEVGDQLGAQESDAVAVEQSVIAAFISKAAKH